MRILSLLLVLALAACADIDKSLYSVSEAVAPKDRVTGQRSLSLADRASQIQQSNQAGAQLLQQYAQAGKPVNERADAQQYARLQRVFQRVHGVSHLADEPWTAVLLPDDEWNAFTNGGTYIFVYEKLMKDLASDDELAAVVGHEIGHVTANHVYESQSYAMASSLAGSKGAKKASFQQAFTLTQEEEADRLGVLYAALAGYDPYAAARVWKKVYDQHGDMLSNHPTNSNRVAATQSFAQEFSTYYAAGRVNPQHAAILASFATQGDSIVQAKPGEGGGLAAVLETGLDAFSKRSQAKAEQQNQSAILQFTQYVGQSIIVIGRQASDAHTLQVELGYKGAYPVKGLNLVAQLGQEQATAHATSVIPPSSRFTVAFSFPASDLGRADLKAIPLSVVYAEKAQ